ncbi:hypothetical protein Xen7305DRAFT_00037820 [Xenococcus sp. PCC 7305]|uniref:COP23 domain-containing protein n=1 Tax=Xenococcus sp. PCC 7305 TaxID=102125 RepID=UPI0002AC46B5|nr:COP23 domain-containing protein [Xenococcus sp. PCC 7305]ELS04054.1 hypothetical protein Xen7305DRAFT_00037820 [Xenococcus sp. PCC 7305]
MNILTKAIVGLGIAASAIAVLGESSSAQPRFFCDEQQMSTVVRTNQGELPMIRWMDGSFPPPWTPLERCREVTARFNTFNNNGTLKYMRAAMMNNNPVICVAGYKGGSCLPNGLLITLKVGSDPNVTFKRIIDRRIWATSGAVSLSDETQGDELISEVDGTVYFDIEGLLR